jgi:hypothetical protein
MDSNFLIKFRLQKVDSRLKKICRDVPFKNKKVKNFNANPK